MHLYSRVKGVPDVPVRGLSEENIGFNRVLEEAVYAGADAGDSVCPEASFGVDSVAEEVGIWITASEDFVERAFGDVLVDWVAG